MNENIILFDKKSECCGCGACMNKCSKGAIQMLEDEEGFVGEGIYFKAAEFTENIISWFGQEEYDKMLQGWLNNVMLNVIYYPEINEFNGNRTIQYRIIEYSMATVREVL